MVCFAFFPLSASFSEELPAPLSLAMWFELILTPYFQCKKRNLVSISHFNYSKSKEFYWVFWNTEPLYFVELGGIRL